MPEARISLDLWPEAITTVETGSVFSDRNDNILRVTLVSQPVSEPCVRSFQNGLNFVCLI